MIEATTSAGGELDRCTAGLAMEGTSAASRT
jgi:hypothetical protein